MTNYVIINGVNSNTINGLGINELPPITKPSMRVLTEEIDGRDGDITTNLGYSAYDKTITIGLFGTGYDIDDIVAFFNGEGTIVFSNEADKYYNYKIINQIDYVALQKFKSASVTFHCQPFKYPLEETPIEIDYDYIEEQDVESATLNTAEATIQVNPLGNTSQTGTPTPSSPIPVNVVSGDNTIVSTGKNLANTKITNWSYLGVSVSYDETTQVLTINGTSTGNAQVSFQNSNFSPISVSNGERINLVVEYISGSAASTGNARITLSDINYTMSVLISLNGINTSKIEYKNISTNLTYDKLNFVYRTGDVYNNLKIKIMVCKGTDTTYEPYTSTSYPIHLGEHWLGWIGNYKDGFIRTTGKNLLNINDVSSTTRNGITYSIENNVVVLNGTSTATTYIGFTLENIIPSGEVISYSANNSVANNMISVRPTNGNTALETMWLNEIDKKRANYTLPSNMDKIYVVVENNVTLSNFVIKLMTNKGDTALPYEPYGTNEWYLEKKIGKHIITDSDVSLVSSYWYNTYGQYGAGISKAILGLPETVTNRESLCNVASKINGQTNIANNTYIFNANASYVFFFSSDFDTKEHANEKLVGANVYYNLDTPTYTPITGTLKDELEALQKAQSYKGTTNINQINNDLPFKMNLKAIEDGSNEGIVNNIGNTYAKPIIELEGTGEINIYLNDVQMLKATLTDKMTIDIAKMEAYNPDTSVLLNRQLIGDISKFLLPSGESTIRIDGNLTKATISNYTRWL